MFGCVHTEFSGAQAHSFSGSLEAPSTWSKDLSTVSVLPFNSSGFLPQVGTNMALE